MKLEPLKEGEENVFEGIMPTNFPNLMKLLTHRCKRLNEPQARETRKKVNQGALPCILLKNGDKFGLEGSILLSLLPPNSSLYSK